MNPGRQERRHSEPDDVWPRQLRDTIADSADGVTGSQGFGRHAPTIGENTPAVQVVVMDDRVCVYPGRQERTHEDPLAIMGSHPADDIPAVNVMFAVAQLNGSQTAVLSLTKV